jgi:hypothetical protein
MFHSTWGHAITDNIRRLWFLKSDDFKSHFKNYPLVYLLCTKREIFTLESYKNFRRLLEILEVDVDNLKLIEQPTHFNKIILPDESFYGSREFTAEYLEAIECIRNFALKNQTPTSSKKIYYLHGMRQTGEEHLAEYFKSKGYEIIRPEKLTLDEQLNILINCESFASTIGSSSHNSVFMRNGQEAIFIPRGVRSFSNNYQLALNQVNSINANYINSTLSIFGDWYNNIFYIVSPQLRRFFGDKCEDYEEEDLKAFLQYVKNSLSRGRSINTNELKDYEKVLSDFMAQLKQRENLIASYDMPPHWEEFRSLMTYQTHIAKKGWGSWNSEEQISNDITQQFDIQAIKINFPSHKVYYSVYYNAEEGWSEEVLSPAQAGTTGKSKPIMGIRIRLDEAGTKEFDILYRVHKFDGQWTDWAKNGEVIYSHGQKINAIQIKLESKLKP